MTVGQDTSLEGAKTPEGWRPTKTSGPGAGPTLDRAARGPSTRAQLLVTGLDRGHGVEQR